MLKAAMIIQAHVMGYMARYDSIHKTQHNNNITKLLRNSFNAHSNQWSLLMLSCTQEAVQEASAVHCGHSEELPGFLLEKEVPPPPLGSAHLPETCAGPAGPPGLQPATGGEEEEGGGGALQEDGGDREVGQTI